MLAILILCVGLQAVAAQAPAPTFEAVSIKPDNSGSNAISGSGFRPGGLDMHNVTLKYLIQNAYGTGGMLADYQVVGATGWMDSDKIDITASTATKPTYAQMMAMLQAALADRFTLKIHHEQRPLDGFALVPSGLLKLKPHAPDGPKGWSERPGSDGSWTISGSLTWGTLISQLRSPVGVSAPIDDKTGLNPTDSYDIDLHFASYRPGATETSDLPSLFAALKDQLGLELKSAKVPVDVIMVDSAQKPTSN